MAIQIIDNFNLGVAKPIDDRFVVGSQSFYTDKNNIPYKYSGLRVWDLDVGVPYVWNGTSWVSENSVSISGSGNANYVPKFIGSGSSTVVANSCIYVSGNRVGVNTGTSVTSGYNLDVDGGIISQGATGFSGVGSLLTNLNVSNISSGLLQLQYLTNGSSTGQVLVSGSSQPNYVNPFTLTVGGSSASVVFNAVADGTVYHLGFFNASSISGTGLFQSRVSVINSSENSSIRQLTYRPSTGNLTSALITVGTFSSTTSTSATLNISSAFNIIPASTAASPAINFSSYGGIYHTTAPNLGISVSGAAKLIAEQTAINFGPQSNNYPRIVVSSTSTAASPSYTWYGDTNTGMFRPSADTIGISSGGTEKVRISSTGLSASNMVVGSGTLINKMIVGSVQVSYNSTTITIMNGTQSFTVSSLGSTTTTVNFRVTLLNSFSSSSNISVISSIDSTSTNHYPWSSICYNRTSTYFDISVVNTSWSSGSVIASFVAFQTTS